MGIHTNTTAQKNCDFSFFYFLLQGIVIVLSYYDCQQLKCTQFHSSYVANGWEKEGNKAKAKNKTVKVKNNSDLFLLLFFFLFTAAHNAYCGTACSACKFAFECTCVRLLGCSALFLQLYVCVCVPTHEPTTRLYTYTYVCALRQQKRNWYEVAMQFRFVLSFCLPCVCVCVRAHVNTHLYCAGDLLNAKGKQVQSQRK